MARFSSTILSFILKIFLIVSWCLLVCAFLLSFWLTIWPNSLSDANTFGVWQLLNRNQITRSISPIGIVLIILSVFSFLFSIILQSIAKRAKFTIGSKNQILGYFSSINFSVIVFTIFAFVGTMDFGKSLAGLNSNYLLFKSLDNLKQQNAFPILNGATWVYWILFIFGLISAITIVFSTIMLLLRALFSRTRDKNINVNA